MMRYFMHAEGWLRNPTTIMQGPHSLRQLVLKNEAGISLSANAFRKNALLPMTTTKDDGRTKQLHAVREIVHHFELASLVSTLRACEALVAGGPIDLAVLGQFKSGKSSLLNALLGENIFPVGAIPVTAVVTRAVAGSSRLVRVTHLDGTVEEVTLERIADFVSEAGNPRNSRQVAVVDVLLPAMLDWPGLRLVDTPGLGSVFIHNTEATHTWMPNVAIALVTISAERPLSDEDRRLLTQARQTAPRVVVLLTKVDLLTDEEQQQVTTFLQRSLSESFGITIPVLLFSCRVAKERWVRQLREMVLVPVAKDAEGQRLAALDLKLASLVAAARGYLAVGLQAADRADDERQRLRAAVLNESVKATLIRDELHLGERSVCERTRSQFETLFRAHRQALTRRVIDALAAEMRLWRGNLAEQTKKYESWLADQITAELTPLSESARPLAIDLLAQAEERFRRIAEAFRDRLSRNIRESTGVTISPIAWEAKRPQLAVIPVAVGRAFMTQWELLWWALPMWLVGGLFRRHVLNLVAWEIEKNLTRLVGDWAAAVDMAVADLRQQAAAWVEAELATLDTLLVPGIRQAEAFRNALQALNQIVVPPAA